MEFNEKLKNLRKSKNITQDELAIALSVSRTAVSKWETGNGYPSIDILKSIAKYYQISLDDLLSTDELLNYSLEREKEIINKRRNIEFIILDLLTLFLLFLPIFSYKKDNNYISIPLFELKASILTLTLFYFGIIVAGLNGIVLTIVHVLSQNRIIFINKIISLFISIFLILVFILTKQPYPGVFALFLGTFKIFVYFKK